MDVAGGAASIVDSETRGVGDRSFANHRAVCSWRTDKSEGDEALPQRDALETQQEGVQGPFSCGAAAEAPLPTELRSPSRTESYCMSAACEYAGGHVGIYRDGSSHPGVPWFTGHNSSEYVSPLRFSGLKLRLSGLNTESTETQPAPLALAYSFRNHMHDIALPPDTTGASRTRTQHGEDNAVSHNSEQLQHHLRLLEKAGHAVADSRPAAAGESLLWPEQPSDQLRTVHESVVSRGERSVAFAEAASSLCSNHRFRRHPDGSYEILPCQTRDEDDKGGEAFHAQNQARTLAGSYATSEPMEVSNISKPHLGSKLKCPVCGRAGGDVGSEPPQQCHRFCRPCSAARIRQLEKKLIKQRQTTEGLRRRLQAELDRNSKAEGHPEPAGGRQGVETPPLEQRGQLTIGRGVLDPRHGSGIRLPAGGSVFPRPTELAARTNGPSGAADSFCHLVSAGEKLARKDAGCPSSRRSSFLSAYSQAIESSCGSDAPAAAEASVARGEGVDSALTEAAVANLVGAIRRGGNCTVSTNQRFNTRGGDAEQGDLLQCLLRGAPQEGNGGKQKDAAGLTKSGERVQDSGVSRGPQERYQACGEAETGRRIAQEFAWEWRGTRPALRHKTVPELQGMAASLRQQVSELRCRRRLLHAHLRQQRRTVSSLLACRTSEREGDSAGLRAMIYAHGQADGDWIGAPNPPNRLAAEEAAGDLCSHILVRLVQDILGEADEESEQERVEDSFLDFTPSETQRHLRLPATRGRLYHGLRHQYVQPLVCSDGAGPAALCDLAAELRITEEALRQMRDLRCQEVLSMFAFQPSERPRVPLESSINSARVTRSTAFSSAETGGGEQTEPTAAGMSAPHTESPKNANEENDDDQKKGTWIQVSSLDDGLRKPDGLLPAPKKAALDLQAALNILAYIVAALASYLDVILPFPVYLLPSASHSQLHKRKSRLRRGPSFSSAACPSSPSSCEVELGRSRHAHRGACLPGEAAKARATSATLPALGVMSAFEARHLTHSETDPVSPQSGGFELNLQMAIPRTAAEPPPPETSGLPRMPPEEGLAHAAAGRKACAGEPRVALGTRGVGLSEVGFDDRGELAVPPTRSFVSAKPSTLHIAASAAAAPALGKALEGGSLPPRSTVSLMQTEVARVSARGVPSKDRAVKQASRERERGTSPLSLDSSAFAPSANDQPSEAQLSLGVSVFTACNLAELPLRGARILQGSISASSSHSTSRRLPSPDALFESFPGSCLACEADARAASAASASRAALGRGEGRARSSSRWSVVEDLFGAQQQLRGGVRRGDWAKIFHPHRPTLRRAGQGLSSRSVARLLADRMPGMLSSAGPAAARFSLGALRESFAGPTAWRAPEEGAVSHCMDWTGCESRGETGWTGPEETLGRTCNRGVGGQRGNEVASLLGSRREDDARAALCGVTGGGGRDVQVSVAEAARALGSRSRPRGGAEEARSSPSSLFVSHEGGSCRQHRASPARSWLPDVGRQPPGTCQESAAKKAEAGACTSSEERDRGVISGANTTGALRLPAVSSACFSLASFGSLPAEKGSLPLFSWSGATMAAAARAARERHSAEVSRKRDALLARGRGVAVRVGGLRQTVVSRGADAAGRPAGAELNKPAGGVGVRSEAGRAGRQQIVTEEVLTLWIGAEDVPESHAASASSSSTVSPYVVEPPGDSDSETPFRATERHSSTQQSDDGVSAKDVGTECGLEVDARAGEPRQQSIQHVGQRGLDPSRGSVPEWRCVWVKQAEAFSFPGAPSQAADPLGETPAAGAGLRDACEPHQAETRLPGFAVSIPAGMPKRGPSYVPPHAEGRRENSEAGETSEASLPGWPRAAALKADPRAEGGTGDFTAVSPEKGRFQEEGGDSESQRKGRLVPASASSASGPSRGQARGIPAGAGRAEDTPMKDAVDEGTSPEAWRRAHDRGDHPGASEKSPSDSLEFSEAWRMARCEEDSQGADEEETSFCDNVAVDFHVARAVVVHRGTGEAFRLSVVDGDSKPERLQTTLQLLNWDLLALYLGKEGVLPPVAIWGDTLALLAQLMTSEALSECAPFLSSFGSLDAGVGAGPESLQRAPWAARLWNGAAASVAPGGVGAAGWSRLSATMQSFPPLLLLNAAVWGAGSAICSSARQSSEAGAGGLEACVVRGGFSRRVEGGTAVSEGTGAQGEDGHASSAEVTTGLAAAPAVSSLLEEREEDGWMLVGSRQSRAKRKGVGIPWPAGDVLSHGPSLSPEPEGIPTVTGTRELLTAHCRESLADRAIRSSEHLEGDALSKSASRASQEVVASTDATYEISHVVPGGRRLQEVFQVSHVLGESLSAAPPRELLVRRVEPCSPEGIETERASAVDAQHTLERQRAPLAGDLREKEVARRRADRECDSAFFRRRGPTVSDLVWPPSLCDGSRQGRLESVAECVLPVPIAEDDGEGDAADCGYEMGTREEPSFSRREFQLSLDHHPHLVDTADAAALTPLDAKSPGETDRMRPLSSPGGERSLCSEVAAAPPEEAPIRRGSPVQATAQIIAPPPSAPGRDGEAFCVAFVEAPLVEGETKTLNPEHTSCPCPVGSTRAGQRSRALVAELQDIPSLYEGGPTVLEPPSAGNCYPFFFSSAGTSWSGAPPRSFRRLSTSALLNSPTQLPAEPSNADK
ncbi:hypothetical protein BESB_056380 [Besnoitia besnoiti]|uniref:Uncharacterized protein n=1 Tax=Besnoitia besnoiti TaxID=94643 RepID=A0A2A9MK56_BESBE|nr:hypothetical protein BESB_056380 [Besnoitia besnoiti]PFH35987.1 hypothetical protein BESB_056380 [Besnoitia besnoiti]